MGLDSNYVLDRHYFPFQCVVCGELSLDSFALEYGSVICETCCSTNYTNHQSSLQPLRTSQPLAYDILSSLRVMCPMVEHDCSCQECSASSSSCCCQWTGHFSELANHLESQHATTTTTMNAINTCPLKIQSSTRRSTIDNSLVTSSSNAATASQNNTTIRDSRRCSVDPSYPKDTGFFSPGGPSYHQVEDNDKIFTFTRFQPVVFNDAGKKQLEAKQKTESSSTKDCSRTNEESTTKSSSIQQKEGMDESLLRDEGFFHLGAIDRCSTGNAAA